MFVSQNGVGAEAISTKLAFFAAAAFIPLLSTIAAIGGRYSGLIVRGGRLKTIESIRASEV